MDFAPILKRLDAYERLTRLDKPIGTLLLLWPTLWAVWLASNGRPAAYILIVFVVGTLLLRSQQTLGSYPDKLTERLEFWAAETPTTTFFAQRDVNGDWRTITYEQALEFARRIGQSLLERGLDAERPVAILSDNGIDHALIALGAMHVGVPVAPVSPAYSLMSKDFAKLRHIFELVRPGLVYAADPARFGPALEAVGAAATPVAELLGITIRGVGAGASSPASSGRARPTGST